MSANASAAPRSVFVVAGETSGDLLGARLARGLREALGARLRLAGVGGPALAAEGLTSLFPIADIAVMGIGPVLRRLPLLLRRIRETADAAITARPDVMVLIDSPDFCHRVAARVKKARPDQKIVIWVSPSVWIWRPGRAKKIARFTDRLMALLPFEPEAHRLLGGPPTSYVGHPFIERAEEARAADRSLPTPGTRPLRLLVLPGSRRSEVSRLMAPFGAVLRRLADEIGPFEVVIPAVDHVRGEIEARLADWPVKPTLVAGEAAKFAAFRAADAALAASGTVTLELALAGVPHVACYRLDAVARFVVRHLLKVPKALRAMEKVHSALLPNLVLGERAVPEFIDDALVPEDVASALADLLKPSEARAAQIDAFARLDAVMREGLAESPGATATKIVLDLLGEG